MSSTIKLYEHNQKAYDALLNMLATLAVQRWLEQWLVAE